MSETVSFLGGAAIAGLAALVLFRGVGGLGLASSPIPQISPSPLVATPSPAPNPIPAPVASPVAAPVAAAPCAADSQAAEARKTEVDNLKLQLERQRFETDRLTYQTQFQQKQIEALTMQGRVGANVAQAVDAAGNPINPPMNAIQPRPTALPNMGADTANPVLTGMMWATGGVVLCLAGGSMLLFIFGAFARQSRNLRVVPSPHTYTIEGYAKTPYRMRYAMPPEEQAMSRAKQANYE